MACSQRSVFGQWRRPGSQGSVITRGRRVGVLLAVGALAMLAAACGSALGGQTPCSVYLSMDGADQQNTIITMYRQSGLSNPSSDAVVSGQRATSTYCADPIPNVNTIDGVFDSRPS